MGLCCEQPIHRHSSCIVWLLLQTPLTSQFEARCHGVPRRAQVPAGSKGESHLGNCTRTPNVDLYPYLLWVISLPIDLHLQWLRYPVSTAANCVNFGYWVLISIYLFKQPSLFLVNSLLSSPSPHHYDVLTPASIWAQGFHSWDTLILLSGQWSLMHPLKTIILLPPESLQFPLQLTELCL